MHVGDTPRGVTTLNGDFGCVSSEESWLALMAGLFSILTAAAAIVLLSHPSPNLRARRSSSAPE